MGYVAYMLINQDNPDIFAFGRESLKGCLDGGGFGLVVYYEKVLLVVWGLGYMLGLDVRIQERIGGEL